MREYILQKIRQFLREIRRQKVLRRVVSILAAIVVFITSYALILPAITMERKTAEQDPGILLDADTEVQNQEADTAGQTESGLAAMPAVSGSAVTLSASGDGYRIEVASIVDESFPAGSVLETREIATGSTEYDIYLQRTEEQFPDGVAAARFFDISIRDQSGNKIQPAAPVEVRIMLDTPEQATGSAVVVHFAELEDEGELLSSTATGSAVQVQESARTSVMGMRNRKMMASTAINSEMTADVQETTAYAEDAATVGEQEQDYRVDILPAETDKGENNTQTITFITTGFSVYGVVHTVDFENGEKKTTLKSGESILLSKIISDLGLKVPGSSEALTLDKVTDVTFSNPELIQIEQLENGDWKLTSLKAFVTRETLTIQVEGKSLTIQVTGVSSKIDVNNLHIIYTEDENAYYVLKTDGTVEVFQKSQCQFDESGRNITFDKLDDGYRWIFHYVYTEYDRPDTLDYQFYFIRPADDKSKSIALNSRTEQELVQYGTNNIAVLPQEGGGFRLEGYNDTKLSFDGERFVPGESACTVNIYEQEPLPAYGFSVVCNEVEDTDPHPQGPRGYVVGTDENDQPVLIEDKSTNYLTTTNSTDNKNDKTNKYEIKALPNPEKREKYGNGNLKPEGPDCNYKFKFDHWELNGETIYVQDGQFITVPEGHLPPEGAVPAGNTIPAGTLTIPYHSSLLSAHFVLNPDYRPIDSEKNGRYINKQTLDDWLQELETKNLPLDMNGTKKTAEVFDYENRIYRVDITAQSSLATFAGDIDMGFIIDVSPSMLFPAKLEPAKTATGAQIGERQLSDINKIVNGRTNGENWGLIPHRQNRNPGPGDGYYIITDAHQTATVCELYFDDSIGRWRLCDASKKREKDVIVPESQDTVKSHYQSSDGPYLIYDAADFVEEEDLQPGSKSREILEKHGIAYRNAVKNRAYYLELSIYNTVQKLKEIKETLSMAQNGTQDRDVKIAWNTFKNYLPNNNTANSDNPDGAVTRQPNFMSVEGESIVLSYEYTGGGTSTDIALLDAAGVKRFDVNDPYNNNSNDGYGRWFNEPDSYKSVNGKITYGQTYNQLKASGNLFAKYGNDDGYKGFQWSGSTTKYAILITDGAPQRSSLAVSPVLVKDAADQLKNDKDNDPANDVHLITIGLGMGDVEMGKALLYDIASPHDGDNYPMFYNAEAGDELQYALYDVVKAILKKAVVRGNVVDVVGEAFYPVDLEDGSPLADGNVINLYGKKIADSIEAAGSALPAAYGIVHYNQETHQYTINWNQQEFDWDGWHGTVYVKAKEDFLGGNAVRTNADGAKVVATDYRVEGSSDWIALREKIEGNSSVDANYSKSIAFESPKVNVNELTFDGRRTTWTVYRGTKVEPSEELKNLFEMISVLEVVTGAETKNDYGMPDTIKGNQHYYAYQESITDDREGENEDGKVFFLMKDLILHLIQVQIENNNQPDQWREFLKEDESGKTILNWDYFTEQAMSLEGIIIPYHEYGLNDNSNLKITLRKEVLKDENALPGTITPIEQYTLMIRYSPDYSVLPPGQGGPKQVDFHTGTYGTMYQGHAAGTETSENIHDINIFEKGFQITKVNINRDVLYGAEFTLYRTSREDDPKDNIYVAEGQNYTFVGKLDTSLSGTAVWSFVEQLQENENYILVETKTPDGYNTIDPIPVTLTITDKYIPKTRSGTGVESETKPETGSYDWIQTASLLLGPKEGVVVRTDQDRHIIEDSAVQDSLTDILYYQIINNAGLELPSTGGNGTDQVRTAGMILMAMAFAAALLWRRTQWRYPPEEGRCDSG